MLSVELSTNRTMTARASPSLDVPSKISLHFDARCYSQSLRDIRAILIDRPMSNKRAIY